jgi:methyl-accepting chemotaxis protein
MTDETAPEITIGTDSTSSPGLIAERRIEPRMPARKPEAKIPWLSVAGWIATALWVAFCFSYAQNVVGLSETLQLPPAQLGEFLIGIVALPALLWMVIGHWQRLATFSRATDALQAQLRVLTEPHKQLDKRFDTVLGALRRQADLFTEASQTALGTLRSTRGALRQETALLEKTVGESTTGLTREAERVRGVVQEANNGLGRLDESLTKSVTRYHEAQQHFTIGNTQLETLVKDSLQQFDDFNGRFDEQVKLIGVATKTLRSSREEAEAAFESVRHSSEATGRDLDALGDRASGLGAHLDGLRTSVTAGINDVIAQAERLQRRGETITGTLGEQSRQIERTLGGVGEIATVLSASGTLAKETAERMRESLGTISGNIAQAASEIRIREDSLATASKASVAALRETVGTLDDIILRSGSAIGGLDRKAGEISFAVATSLNRITDLTGGLAQTEEALRSAGTQSTVQIEATTDLLKTQVATIHGINQDLEATAAKATIAIDKVAMAGSGIETAMTQLELTARKADREISAIADEVSERSGQISESLADFGRDLQQHNGTLETHLGKIEQVDRRVRQLAGETGTLMGHVDRIGDKSQTVFTRIGSEIETNATVVNNLLEKNTGKLQQVQSELAQAAESADASVERVIGRSSEIERTVTTTLAKLGELQRELDAVRQGIEHNSTISAERLGSVTATVRAEFSDVRDGANRALERLEQVVAAIASGAATANNATDSAEARLKEALALMQQNGQAFNEAINAAMAGMQRAERVLTDEQENLGRTAEAAAIRFSRLGQDLAGNSFDLSNTVAASVEKLTGISSTVDRNIGSLVENVAQAEATLEGYMTTIDSLSSRTTGITEGLQSQSQSLESNIVALGTTIETAQEKARQSAQSITVVTAELSANAEKAQAGIGAVVDRLKDQSRVLSETEADSRALAGRVTAMLGEKALELANAARQAATEATVLREADAKVRRDIFLNAAKSVLDGLQSLSVDLTRVLDKDVPEKAWKGLSRSDVPGFTRRLVALRDHVPESEVRGKFLTDSDFRTQVQQYLHQFEALLEQAMANDQGDILSSTLMSSDVGKIYYFLSSAIGRERSALQRTG